MVDSSIFKLANQWGCGFNPLVLQLFSGCFAAEHICGWLVHVKSVASVTVGHRTQPIKFKIFISMGKLAPVSAILSSIVLCIGFSLDSSMTALKLCNCTIKCMLFFFSLAFGHVLNNWYSYFYVRIPLKCHYKESNKLMLL